MSEPAIGADDATPEPWHSRPAAVARTLTVNTLVAGQLFYLFNARYIHTRAFGIRRLLANRAALIAAGCLLVFQTIFTYAPLFQTWFGTAPLQLRDWLWATGVGAAVFVVVELEKAVLRRWHPAAARPATRSRVE